MTDKMKNSDVVDMSWMTVDLCSCGYAVNF